MIRTITHKAALALPVALLLCSPAAHATTITGTYTETYSGTSGTNPSIGRYGLQSNGITASDGGTVGHINLQNLLSGSPTAFETNAINLLSVTPEGTHGTDHGTITLTFTLQIGSYAQTIVTETAVYNAKYSNQTDSVTFNTGNGWTALTNSPICAPVTADSSDGRCVVDTISLADGPNGPASLEIILNDAEDWTIYPTISFDLLSISNSQVPEPGSLALLATALAGLAFVWRRRNGPLAKSGQV